jgi:hypothetical protein
MVERAKDPLAGNAAGRSINDPSERQLALEVRSRRLAYAVFQGSSLLDWGARRYAAGATKADGAIEKVRLLLNVYASPVVVVRETRHAKSSKMAARVLRKIRTDLQRQSVRMVVVGQHDVRRFFAQYGCHTKHDVASLLARRFPELIWRLPRPRRPWDPEAHAVVIFDAIGTAITFNGVPLFPEGTEP